MAHSGWITYLSGMAAGTHLRMAKVIPGHACTCFCLRRAIHCTIRYGAEHAVSTGNLAAKGKIPYAILTLMDTLRNHPGQVGAHFATTRFRHDSLYRFAVTGSCSVSFSTWHVPQVADLDAIIQTSDFPCMLRLQPGTGALAPPIFGYNSHPKFVDIPFPDYSYWGHEYRRLLGGLHNEPHQRRCLGQSDTEHARHMRLIL